MPHYTPRDAQEPRWTKYEKVHCWRNYVSDELQAMWHTFTPLQQDVLARSYQAVADAENWE